MLKDVPSGDLEQFLRGKGRAKSCPALQNSGTISCGTMLGAWRVESFLGHGGSGEVYQVVHSVTQQKAAAKILTRTDEATRKRFRGEIAFLAQNKLPQFPHYFASGECDGHDYLILELLEPMDVPTDESAIADYLLDVCSCVRALHLSGIVHRDLKPKNIMRRTSGEVVLIDFGLVKDTLKSPWPTEDVSVISGKAVGVGTPNYAAPEQLIGGKVSPAADIHALGRIANAAFNGNPPRTWEGIIRRATSSIPEQRYKTVDDFAAAIRKRNRSQNFVRAGFAAALFALFVGVFVARDEVSVQRQFDDICKTVTTNVVTRQLLWQKAETNELGAVYLKEQAFRNITNTVDVTLVQLNHETNVFAQPLQLKSNHEYWIVGPGILDASVASEGTNTTIRLKNCVFLNRSTVQIKKAGIRYAFQGGAYLNFTDMNRPRGFSPSQLEGFDSAVDEVRFRGPLTIKELNNLRFSYFPHHISRTSREYVVKSMNTTPKDERANFHLDPNRIRTDAEIHLFANVFSISIEEARRILKNVAIRCNKKTGVV